MPVGDMEMSEPSMCFACNEKTEKLRVDRFVKQYGNEWAEIKIFECQGCKHHSCQIQKSEWTPK